MVVEYQMMSDGLVLTSCVHGGPIPLAQVAKAAEEPSWLEQESGLPAGTIAAELNALCRRYRSCGVMALDGDAVIGKVRFSPAELGDNVAQCVQQSPERHAAFDPELLPQKEDLEPKSLELWCLQVVDAPQYRGRGIASTMLQRMVSWGREQGWEEVVTSAIRRIPPLLDWTGMLPVDTYLKLGFSVTGSEVNPDLLEGVAHMRAGGHGEDIRSQWGLFAGLSDDEAATLYRVALPLRTVR